MILYVDKNSGILFIKNKKTGEYVPVFIPLVNSLSNVEETIPGPLKPEALLESLKNGNFIVEITDSSPLFYSSGDSIPSKVKIKIFKETSMGFGGEEIPGIWGFDLDEKPVIMLMKGINIQLLGNIMVLEPSVHFRKASIPSIIETGGNNG